MPIYTFVCGHIERENMKEITKTYKVYEFLELSEDVQKGVIDDNRYMETEHDWYWSCYENFEEQLKDIGIEVRSERKYYGAFSFSLDRDWHFSIDDGSIVDIDKFWDFLGWEKTGNEYEEATEIGLGLKTQHYGGGRTRTYVTLGWSEHEAMTEKLQELFGEFLRTLQTEYEYLTSDDCIRDVIETNEYVFLDNGEMFS